MALPVLATQEDLTYAAQKQKEEFVAKETDKDLITKAERDKLAGITEGANKYTHPSGDGNSHVPATGTTNSGKVLKAGATAGSAAWGTLAKSDVGLGNVDNTKDMDKPVSTAQQAAINAAVAGVYKIKGSVAFASLPTTGMVAGDVYNITNAFTTDAKFTEGIGKSYPAGTNVVYTTDSKWDCMSGIYDLSVFIKASDLVQMTKADIDAMYA